MQNTSEKSPNSAEKSTEGLEIVCEGNVDDLISPSSASNINNKQNQRPKAAKAEFILPFNKRTFENIQDQENLFQESIQSIRRQLPKEARNNITIVKTIIERPENKKLRAVRVIAPPELQKSIQELKIKGINVRGRHINAWGPREFEEDMYPKQLNVQFTNLPHFIPDEIILEEIGIPSMKPISTIIKQKHATADGGYVFTGRAHMKIMVESETCLENVKKWTEQNCTKTFTADEMEFYCNIPSVLTCSHCKSNKKQHVGHHDSYCNLLRQQKYEEQLRAPRVAVDNELDDNEECESASELNEDPTISQTVSNIRRQTEESFSTISKKTIPENDDTQMESLGSVIRRSGRTKGKTRKRNDEKESYEQRIDTINE